ncbi:unnamed protein product [Rodentolepis nana]|uniref:Reverse transcriptase domain-containing protein n=1 Tax=Rodentolepis nana TaxID=102285 RepID=A0A0R3TJ76_RODNA|nr:unnamed protein product [Rodentolepis nana]
MCKENYGKTKHYRVFWSKHLDKHYRVFWSKHLEEAKRKRDALRNTADQYWKRDALRNTADQTGRTNALRNTADLTGRTERTNLETTISCPKASHLRSKTDVLRQVHLKYQLNRTSFNKFISNISYYGLPSTTSSQISTMKLTSTSSSRISTIKAFDKFISNIKYQSDTILQAKRTSFDKFISTKVMANAPIPG